MHHVDCEGNKISKHTHTHTHIYITHKYKYNNHLDTIVEQ